MLILNLVLGILVIMVFGVPIIMAFMLVVHCVAEFVGSIVYEIVTIWRTRRIKVSTFNDYSVRHSWHWRRMHLIISTPHGEWFIPALGLDGLED